MSRKKLGKKGSLQDILFVAIVIVVFGLVTLIGFKVASDFNEQISSIDAINTGTEMGNRTLALSDRTTGYYSGVVSNMFFFLLIGLCIAAFTLAALVRVHPIFIPIFFIALVFVILMSGILSNLYTELAQDNIMKSEADQLWLMSTIFKFLPMFVAIFGILIMIVLYKLGGVPT